MLQGVSGGDEVFGAGRILEGKGVVGEEGRWVVGEGAGGSSVLGLSEKMS
ncbi:hypothetical protein COLO4_08468 [Corchorus olitorius]|uniref:Uncharacterized protein n=1 Tax=Corchorus olitorius TaxID=93759 RepID=A0A1R3KFM6_9ROSI|nr:hypothetical protein COLO4_08468 [Corchorus olitorius]